MPLYRGPSTENVRVYDRVGYWRRAVELARKRERDAGRREALAWVMLLAFGALVAFRAGMPWDVFDVLLWSVIGWMTVRSVFDARRQVRRARRRTALIEARVGTALRWERLRALVEDERRGE